MLFKSIKRYDRCKWMGFVAIAFAVMAMGFLIPGIIGVSGLNNYNDTLLYLGLIDTLFALLFFVGWISCQMEAEDQLYFPRDIPIKKEEKRRLNSVSSLDSLTSVNENQPVLSEDL